jgi:hypothetical protein
MQASIDNRRKSQNGRSFVELETARRSKPQRFRGEIPRTLRASEVSGKPQGDIKEGFYRVIEPKEENGLDRDLLRGVCQTHTGDQGTLVNPVISEHPCMRCSDLDCILPA